MSWFKRTIKKAGSFIGKAVSGIGSVLSLTTGNKNGVISKGQVVGSAGVVIGEKIAPDSVNTTDKFTAFLDNFINKMGLKEPAKLPGATKQTGLVFPNIVWYVVGVLLLLLIFRKK